MTSADRNTYRPSKDCSDQNMDERLVDQLVQMAVQGEEESDNDEEYLSASDGEAEDTKITQWAESLSDLKPEADPSVRTRVPDSREAKDECNDKSMDMGDRSKDSDKHTCPATTPDGDGGNKDDCREGDNKGDDEEGDNKDDGDEGDNDGSERQSDAGEDDGDKSKSGEEKSEETKESEEELEKRRQAEEDVLTEEERQRRLAEAVKVKTTGNEAFKGNQYTEAMEHYSKALEMCPLKYVQQRSIMLSNRAACRMKEEDYEAAVKDCSKAIDLQPTYIKAINRRADAYEKLEKLEDALKDHQRIVELDRSQAGSFHACMRLENQIKERNEKMKEEVLGKLKDLGNMVLRPFGLSTNNFQMQQDPSTGSYSVQFVQNPPTNGH